jgi:D-cysteine desulfhydrase
MVEVSEQPRVGLVPEKFDQVVFACGSGGTAAGIALGLGATGLAPLAHAIAVCDDRHYFERVVANLIADARALRPDLGPAVPLRISDEFQGPGYGVMSAPQKHFLREVATRTGLVLDPVYSGKALYALSQLASKPKRALFIHTGGLPGLLASSTLLDSE